MNRRWGLYALEVKDVPELIIFSLLSDWPRFYCVEEASVSAACNAVSSAVPSWGLSSGRA